MTIEKAAQYPSPEDYQLTLSPEVHEDCFIEEALAVIAERDDVPECIYREILDSHTSFNVLATTDKAGDRLLIFKIRTNVTGEEKRPAELFLKIDEHNNLYSMTHRWVETKAYGVSGTDLLQKAESILARLFARGIYEPRPLFIKAGQVNVLNWAIKNGFEFTSPAEASLYGDVQTNPEKYRTDISVTDESGWTREGFIFERKVADTLPFEPGERLTKEKIDEVLDKGISWLSLTKKIKENTDGEE